MVHHDRDHKPSGGYRVIGPNTTDGAETCWYFHTLDTANTFAKTLCEDTGAIVEVARFVGHWRPMAPPVEFVPTPTPDDLPEQQPLVSPPGAGT